MGIISRMERGRQGKFRKLYLYIPILAALCFGLVDPIRKLGIDLLDSPILGAAIGSTTALVCLTILMVYKGKVSFSIKEKGSIYFVISGLIYSLALVALFFALRFGRVVFVTPLTGTAPLFVLLFSHIILKGIEKVTPFLVIGGILIVTGSILVTIG